MAIMYRLVGYDRKTERQSVRIDIPHKHASFVKRVAGLNQYRDLVADHPLSDSQARDIAGTIGTEIDVTHLEFFLEPYLVNDRRQPA